MDERKWTLYHDMSLQQTEGHSNYISIFTFSNMMTCIFVGINIQYHNISENALFHYHYVVSNLSYLNVWNTYSRYKSKMMVFDILAFVNIMVWKSISSCILQIISHRNNNLTSSTCWWWPRTLDSFQTGAQRVLLTFRTLGSIKVFI